MMLIIVSSIRMCEFNYIGSFITVLFALPIKDVMLALQIIINETLINIGFPSV